MTVATTGPNRPVHALALLRKGLVDGAADEELPGQPAEHQDQHEAHHDQHSAPVGAHATAEKSAKK